jgi:hypothetical protein
MQEKTIEIVAPEGYEVDKEKSSFDRIVFRPLPEKGLPKTWKDMGYITGCVVHWNHFEGVGILGSDVEANQRNRAIWPTEAEAEASIALAQLCQLRDRYNGGWKPDWNAEAKKYVIYRSIEGISGASYFTLPHVLAFKTPELRDEFMKNFADLIEKAKPLLG